MTWKDAIKKEDDNLILRYAGQVVYSIEEGLDSPTFKRNLIKLVEAMADSREKSDTAAQKVSDTPTHPDTPKYGKSSQIQQLRDIADSLR
tara:strand:+ start:5609 stop:5878 length:270 start_codon:yes stop_codon:yes gene_type:complete